MSFFSAWKVAGWVFSLPAGVGVAGVSALLARNYARSSWHSDFSTSNSLRSICISALCSTNKAYKRSGIVNQCPVVLSGDTSTVTMQRYPELNQPTHHCHYYSY